MKEKGVFNNYVICRNGLYLKNVDMSNTTYFNKDDIILIKINIFGVDDIYIPLFGNDVYNIIYLLNQFKQKVHENLILHFSRTLSEDDILIEDENHKMFSMNIGNLTIYDIIHLLAFERLSTKLNQLFTECGVYHFDNMWISIGESNDEICISELFNISAECDINSITLKANKWKYFYDTMPILRDYKYFIFCDKMGLIQKLNARSYYRMSIITEANIKCSLYDEIHCPNLEKRKDFEEYNATNKNDLLSILNLLMIDLYYTDIFAKNATDLLTHGYVFELYVGENLISAYLNRYDLGIYKYKLNDISFNPLDKVQYFSLVDLINNIIKNQPYIKE